MKAWKEELFPTLVYCRQQNVISVTQYRLIEAGMSCSDVTLRHNRSDEMLEITMAFRSQVPGQNPGQQEALRWEKLRTDGSVSATATLKRVKGTRAVEYAEPDIARSLSELVEGWTEGLEWSLRKKKRPGYGVGKTLLVYADGLSGDFEHPRREGSLCEILNRVTPDALANEFDFTAIVGWHPGWFEKWSRHSGRASRDPESRGS
jgi:hypothetical protein